MIFEPDPDDPDPEPAPALRRDGSQAALDSPFFCGDFEFRHRFISRDRPSGDFLHYRNCAGARASFLFGDVSGSGAEAARVARHLRSRFASLKDDETPLVDALGGKPSALLRYLDRELRALNSGHYATAFAGVLDARKRVLYYSSAGQWPLPALRTAKGVVRLKGSGPPLGMFENCRVRNYRRKLPAHFLLALCTDGVSEHPDRAMIGAGVEPTAEQVGQSLAREAATGSKSDDALVLTVCDRILQ